MRPLQLLIVLIVLLLPLEAHDCIHSRIQARNKKNVVSQNYLEYTPGVAKKRSVLGADLTRFSQPMKILIDLSNLDGDKYSCYNPGDTITYYDSTTQYICTQADVLSTNRTVLVDYITEAVNIYQNTLAVMPVSQVTVDPSNNCNEIKYSSTYNSPVPGYNYVLFVTARPIASASTLAYASFCDTDQYGRPTSGVINISPAKLKTDSLSRKKQIGVMAHETCHALGFSSQKLQSDGYIVWNDDGSHTSILPNQFIKTVSLAGKTAKVITLPTVTEAVQTHFGCSEMQGAELEDNGSAGTVGSHWEKRVFNNEYMTGSDSTFPVLSNITFSLLEDSGWYGVYNSSLIETLIWGIGRGCNFATGPCSGWLSASQDMGYRCDQSSPKIECTFDFRSIGYCNYQSPDSLSDYCTYYVDDDSNRCDNPNSPSDVIKLNAGESRTSESRCIISSLLKIDDNLNAIPVAQQQEYRCYRMKCKSPTELMVGVPLLDRYVYYPCPLQGGDITVIGFNGKISCINNMATAICADAPVDVWPKITKVNPTQLTPSSTITITGQNFTSPLTVIIRQVSKTVVLNGDNQIQAQLPSEEAWSTFSDLFSRKESVVVIDSKNRTAVFMDSITIQLDFFSSLGRFFKYNPLWAGLIFGGIAIIIILIVLCCYCCCCKKKKDK